MKLKGKKIKKTFNQKKIKRQIKKNNREREMRKKKGLTSLLALFILTYEIERKKIGKKYSIKKKKKLERQNDDTNIFKEV